MSGITQKLKTLINKGLLEHASTLDEIQEREVYEIEWFNVLEGLPVDETKLFNEQGFTITPKGKFRFNEKQKDGFKGVSMDFMSIGMKIKYDGKLDEFFITNIGEFVATRE